MRGLLSACLAVLAVVSACGGRLVKSDSDEQTGATANAGGTESSTGATMGRGGATGAGASGNRAGQASGGALGRAGAASGGATSVAGASSMGGTPCGCDPIACGAGFVTVPNADGCCYHCECRPMLCPGIACASGSHLEVQPGLCCPTCVQDDCVKQRASYQDFKKQLLDKYAYGCMTANDCTVYYDKSACGAACGDVVWKGALDNLRTNLEGYAQQNCSERCAVPVPPCDPPAAPSCIAGRCE